jgi:hypothetical protein
MKTESSNTVKITTRFESWRNENPGEGGTTQGGFLAEDSIVGGEFFPAGSPVDLGRTGNGHRLHQVEGGWESRPYSHGAFPVVFSHPVEICCYQSGKKTLTLSTHERAGRKFRWPYTAPPYAIGWKPQAA